jgi:hypothetical protein
MYSMSTKRVYHSSLTVVTTCHTAQTLHAAAAAVVIPGMLVFMQCTVVLHVQALGGVTAAQAASATGNTAIYMHHAMELCLAQ